MDQYTLVEDSGTTYGILSWDCEGTGWTCNIAEIAETGDVIREILNEDQFVARCGFQVTRAECLLRAMAAIFY